MLKNYVKIAVRTIRRHPSYTFINGAGLAVGVASCLLILLYIQDERSYDRHHPDAERLYRVTRGPLDAAQGTNARTMPPLAERLVADYPEVEQATRLYSRTDVPVRYQDRLFLEDRFHYADSTVFELFSIPLVKGHPRTALARPHTVIITEAMADKYFGDEDPIGQTIQANTFFEFEDYTVTAVAANPPPTSHLPYQFIASFTSTPPGGRSPDWLFNGIYTYVKLRDNQDPAALEAKLPDLLRRHITPQLAERGHYASYDAFVADGQLARLFLEPVTRIHLYSDLDHPLGPPGTNPVYLFLFGTIAGFVLVIACINFTNLATARAASRAKEIGVRKMLGSQRRQLIGQFLFESMLLSVGAHGLALALVATALPLFNQVTDKALTLDAWFTGKTIIALLGSTVLVGLLAGSYPAFYLSAFRPIAVLKGLLRPGKRGRAGLRNGLVVFQFVVSVALLVGTLVIDQQLRYIQDKNLGFDREHVVVISRTWALGLENGATFKQELLRRADVVDAAYMGHVPGHTNYALTRFAVDDPPAEQRFLRMAANHAFDDVLRLTIVQGRSFSEDYASDSLSAILNEAAVRHLGWEHPLGKTITPLYAPDRPFTVIGVVQDYHFDSLHEAIAPLVIYPEDGEYHGSYLAVRIRPGAVPATVAALEAAWKRFLPDEPFEYTFLDQIIAARYATDQRTRTLFTFFAALAILIGSLGLFGLAAYATEQRTKEIGIRKVLGATVTNIVVLLTKDFARLVLIAIALAVPLAYFAMTQWLDTFAVRIEISWRIFLMAGLIALLVAALTISYRALKAALADPAQSLRYE